MKRTFYRLLAVLLTLIMLVAALPLQAFAAKPNVYRDDSEFLIEKLSNPTTGEGEADGMTVGGDRKNSYAWTTARLTDEHGDYIYVGSNRNILFMGMRSVALNNPSISNELIASAVNLITNGELDASYDEMYNSKIFRYNLKTGKTELFYDSAKDEVYPVNIGFRSSVIFKDKLYMNSTGAQKSITWCIANNGVTAPEPVFENAGSYIRAITVSTDKSTMYLGGTVAKDLEDTGDDDLVYQIAIYNTTNGEDFNKIADYKDFLRYEAEGYHTSGGDVWELCEYKGDLYLTLMTLHGAIIFKGNNIGVGTTGANEYGWKWVEFAGESDSAPYDPGFGNVNNYALTPYIYNDDLYFLSFTNAMDAGIHCVTETFKMITDDDGLDMDKYFESLRFMERNLDNETYIFRLTSDGKMQMVLGDADTCPESIEYVAKMGAGFNDAEYSCTQYNWRATIFNGKLYIGTFDASSYYKYFTKLTNGELFEMDDAEAKQQLDYLWKFLDLIIKKNTPADNSILAAPDNDIPSLAAAQYLAALNTATNNDVKNAPSGISYPSEDTIKQLIDILEYLRKNLGGEAVTSIVSKILHDIKISDGSLSSLRSTLESLKKLSVIDGGIIDSMIEIVDGVLNMFRNVDQDDIDCYVRVSDTIANNDNPGFELYCTEDGVNYKTVTNDGFGDKYNYGCRTLIAFDGEDDPYAGVYVGTANPFYGCQLWKITEKDVDIDDVTFDSNIPTIKFDESKHLYFALSFKNSFDFSFIPNDSNSVIYVNGKKVEGSNYSVALKYGINIVGVTVKTLTDTQSYTFTIINPMRLFSFGSLFKGLLKNNG